MAPHDRAAAVVDGNVVRVLCRLAGWEAVGRGAGAVLRRKIDVLAAELVDPERPGDFNQAMMELGATVCLPRKPQCLICPLRDVCITQGEHKTAPRARMLSREVAHALVVRTGPVAGQMQAVPLAAGSTGVFDWRVISSSRLSVSTPSSRCVGR